MAGDGADWNAYNLPAIWSMIEPENACAGADRVLSWMNLADACRDQHRRLLAAREHLAEVWPPEKNASALRFIRQLDMLAESLEQTLTRAEDTRVGLQGVFDALSTAQSTIRPLAAERAVVAGDLIPRFLDHAEDEYDERARQAMRVAEAAIGEHGRQIQAPLLYRLQPNVNTQNPELSDPGTPVGGTGPAHGTLQAVPTPVAVPHDPPAPSAVAGPPAGAGASSGPGVALAGLVQAPGVPAAAGVVLPAPALPGAQVAGAALPAGVIGAGLGLPPTIGGFGRTGVAGVAGVGGVRTAVGVRQALPSGAVIGSGGPAGRIGGQAVGGAGRNGSARGIPGQAVGGAGRNGSARGIPGQAAGGAGRNGSARGVPGQAVDGAGRNARSGDGDGEAPAGVADQRWGVLAGVAPVITASTARPEHDPGPGVIGRDR